MTAPGRLGRYELLARIATGGMGEIFLARLGGAAGFEKLCVIKRILPHLADDARFREMLVGEAQVAANMSHANICHVYELEEADHQLYIAMEYLEGVTLLGLLRRYAREHRKLEPGFVAGVIQQAAEGLHYAHELCNREGESLWIIHRDVSPSNLFVTEAGVIKVHDFGVAKAKNAAHTQSGALKGKHAYMAPEQLRGRLIDRRVDIFGLGVVAHEMLAGRQLFQRKTDYLTFEAVMSRPLPSLERDDLAPEVMAVLDRALALSPTDRYMTVREFATALTEALVGDKRPWGQVEIGNLIRHEFADELRRHNAEISGVIQRLGRESTRAMPVILQNPADPDEGDYFAIETGVIDPAPAQVTEPLPVAPPPPRPPSRAPFATVIIAAVLVLAGGIVAVDRVRAAPDRRPAPVTANPPDPYGTAVAAQGEVLARCWHDAAPPPDAKIMVEVGLDGTPRKVWLEPATIAQPPVAGCVEQAIRAIRFPRAPEDRQVALALRPR